jgi:capsular polysaccharide biosynthesis protein
MLFEDYLRANKRFFQTRTSRLKLQKKSLYVDPGASNSVFLNANLRIAMAIAETKKLRPTVMATRYGIRKERAIISSFAACQIVTTFGTMLAGCLAKGLGVWRCFTRVRSGSTLARLSIAGHSIGKHIYDRLIRRHRLPTLGALSIKARIEIAGEVAYYFGLQRLFDRKRFSFAVLGDNAYRQGIAAEILKHRGIPSLSAIDLDGLAGHLYRTSEDYANHSRTPDSHLVTRLDRDPATQRAALIELEARISGKQLQHDVIRAYSDAKHSPDAQELRQRYGATGDRKLVLVMAHIFQDAPHIYPDTLFRDYSHWLVETCRRLEKNPNVALVVKEHPAVDLYSEQNVLEAILSQLAPQSLQIVRDINTRSFFDCADVVVTCGGTCGVEFPCFGVPVIVAARPPYSGFPHIHRPASREEYYAVLDNIHLVGRLTDDQIQLARTVFYTLQVAQKVDKTRLGLGTQGYSLGSPPSEEQMFQEMVDEMATGTGHNRLVPYIHNLLESEHSNIVNWPYLDSSTFPDTHALQSVAATSK